MEHTRSGDLLVVRMDPGEAVVETLLAVMKMEGIVSGVIVSGIGALDGLEVGYYDPAADAYERSKLEGSHELVSLSGTVAWSMEQGFQPHIHVALGRRDHTLHGGHLFAGKVSVTAEVVLRVLPEGAIRRDPNPGSALTRLRPSRAR